jgi:serine/threonine protein kinase/WD40 repeat protein
LLSRERAGKLASFSEKIFSRAGDAVAMVSYLKSRCSHCSATVKVNQSHVGKRVRCPACKESFEVASVEVAGAALLDKVPLATATIVASKGNTIELCSSAQKNVSSDGTAPQLGRLGRFELKEILGQGAFGRVYRAYDPQLDRQIALKVPIFGPDEKHKIQRFLAEARSAGRLRHPNIVPTYESGQADGQYYIAAQFVAGEPLSHRVKDNRSEFRQAAEWVRQLAEALAYAHSEGIVHRDIKPDNIMLDEKSIPQIMDFGLAKRANEDSAMTTDGSIVGTPAYMPPEQARGDLSNTGPHSDQYSLGVVFYELLTGRRPFEGPPYAVIAAVITTEPPSPRSLRQEVPKDLEAICQWAMAKEVHRRYEGGCRGMAEDLARWLRGEVTFARPITLPERFSRWCRRNPTIAGLSTSVALITLLALSAVTLALLSANSSRIAATKSAETAEQQRQEAERQKQDALAQRAEAERHRQEADRQRQTAEAALAKAIEQERLARTSQQLAETKSQEAKAAQAAADLKSKELADTVAKLSTEVNARKSAETASSNLTAKLDTAMQTGPELVYRDRIAKANTAVVNGALDDARSFLDQCSQELRGWEWRYLSAASSGKGVASRSVETDFYAVGFTFSPDGKYVVSKNGPDQYNSYNPNGKRMPTNSVIPFNADYGRTTDLSTADGASGPMTCAFSRDSKTLLAVTTIGKKSQAMLWARSVDGGWIAGGSLGSFDGITVACAEGPNKKWLIVTTDSDKASSDGYVALKRPLRLVDVSSRRDIDLLAMLVSKENAPLLKSSVGVAQFSGEGRLLDVFSEVYWADKTQIWWYQFDLQENAFRLVTKQTPEKLLLPDEGPSRRYRTPGFFTNVGFLVSRDSAGCLTCKSGVVVDGNRRPDMDTPIKGQSAFTPDGKRLVVVTSDGVLHIYDPRSGSPTSPLLELHQQPASKVPPGKNQPALGISPTGEVIATSIGKSVTFYDSTIKN